MSMTEADPVIEKGERCTALASHSNTATALQNMLHLLDISSRATHYEKTQGVQGGS